MTTNLPVSLRRRAACVATRASATVVVALTLAACASNGGSLQAQSEAPKPAVSAAVKPVTKPPVAAADSKPLAPPVSELTPTVATGQSAAKLPPVSEPDPTVSAIAAVTAAPAKPAEIWARIESGFGMSDIEHPLVDRHTKWYLDHPDYVRRMVERSRRYLYFVVEELQRRNLPTELALLPMIESGYNPLAHSHARAAGMWQFIPSTGKLYGLDQDWWADERRDVVSSTRAALDYLERIYVMHGDWHLTLASYNWGEGAVKRAVEKNRRKGLPTTYEYLKMPAETRGYVPKLQAVKNILSNPGLREMLELATIPDEPYFTAIERPEEMDISLAAQFAEIPIEEFVALNPAHNRPILRTDVPLLLPRDHVDRFLERVAKHDEPFVSWQKYVFQKKDRIDKVAKKFGLTEQELRLANGLTGKRRNVRPGQQLMVPLPGKATPETLAVVDAMPPFSLTDPPPKKRRTFYRKRTKLAALVPSAKDKAGKAPKKKKVSATRAKKKARNTRG